MLSASSFEIEVIPGSVSGPLAKELVCIAPCYCNSHCHPFAESPPHPEATSDAPCYRCTHCSPPSLPEGPPASERAQASMPKPARADAVLGLMEAADESGVVSLAEWTEELALEVLDGVESLIWIARVEGEPQGRAVMLAMNRAEEVARAVFGFDPGQPYRTLGFISIVAVGVLVRMSPWAVEMMGFRNIGTIEGSFADYWVKENDAYIHSTSYRAFFQNLGMIWDLI